MLSIQRCRVCGKEYEACHTLRPATNTFRWQAVACSPECGEKFLSAILASRAVAPANNAVEDTRAADVEVVNDETEATADKEETNTRKKKAKK